MFWVFSVFLLGFQAFVMGVTRCSKLIPLQYFISMQTLILLPMALFRDIAKLSTTALIADAFILAGLIYIFGTEAGIIAREGIADVKLFNPRDFPLFIG
jgi:proton-coupled amino acid transporter